MAVAVIFPDGTIKQVVAALKLEQGRFVQCPINCDPQWKYQLQADQWVARSRHAKIRALPKAEREAWWQGISHMADDVAPRDHENIGPRRSAA